MGNLFGASGDEKNEMKNELPDSEIVEDAKMRLRKEELDIAKDKVKSGEVSLHKEIIEEQQSVDVPVTHEEVVIKRKAMNEPSDTPIGEEETINIPVSQEHVEVGKHTVITGEVSAHKRAVEDMEKVEETLKREEVRVDVDGDPNIVADQYQH